MFWNKETSYDANDKFRNFFVKTSESFYYWQKLI